MKMARQIAYVRCQNCDTVAVNISDCTVRYCLTTGWTELRYTCPRCGQLQMFNVVKSRIADVLGMTSDLNYSPPAKLEEWRLPQEFYERPTDAPPLTPVDLLEFAMALDALPSAGER